MGKKQLSWLKNLHGKKAAELVKELAAGEPGQIAAFNNDLFVQVLEDCGSHERHLLPLMRKIQELRNIEASKKMNNQDLEEHEKTTLRSFNSGALIHHLSLLRNKRCLMTYVYNRAEIIRNLGWTGDAVLPEEMKEKLSSSEKEYLKNHRANLESYIDALKLELAVDMVPPKDPCIKVRVLEDIGNVMVGDQFANLTNHAILFLRRTDVEQYIAQGLMEELTD